VSIRAEELKTQALSLSPEERVDIVQTLLESLDDDPGADPAGYAEILRRAHEVRSGNAEMIPGEEFGRELEIAAGWGEAEAGRRWQAPLHGDIEAIDAEVVMADLRKRLGIPGDGRSSREIAKDSPE
jgi:putative addiction module component (TIGR02574 family)